MLNYDNSRFSTLWLQAHFESRLRTRRSKTEIGCSRTVLTSFSILWGWERCNVYATRRKDMELCWKDNLNDETTRLGLKLKNKDKKNGVVLFAFTDTKNWGWRYVIARLLSIKIIDHNELSSWTLEKSKLTYTTWNCIYWTFVSLGEAVRA